jgi:serine phosphatase RsbU (regulator of sigma subunit)
MRENLRRSLLTETGSREKPSRTTCVSRARDGTSDAVCGRRRTGARSRGGDAAALELARAVEIERRLRPVPPRCVPGVDVAAVTLPASQLGGDFYDWAMPEPDVVALTIADVMGNGAGAALLMVVARAYLRALGHRFESPAERARELSRLLEPELALTESYVTFLEVWIDLRRHRARYVDAGHGCALVRRARGPAERLEVGCPPVGIADPPSFQDGEIPLEAGDALVLFTDGLFDACAELDCDPLKLEPHLAGVRTAAETVDRVVALGGESRADDLTVVTAATGTLEFENCW